jgi:DNA (cytosine-5)-methyltransferase 1
MTLRYLELFAGAGGLSLGLERAGMQCVAHAEIAPFPRRVLRHRWPDTPLYGDVSELDGRAIVEAHGPVDLLAGGSPCQDLSVAGKRAGLSGARSGLFYQQLRLWEETRATYLLWENVAGALSSRSGKDFAAVLSAIVGATVPVPRGGWGGDERGGGVAAGPRAVAAWRLLDAQWFGVPQRRLRVFVLGARAGGVDPAEVLLEPEGVRRDSPTRREARESTPGSSGNGAPSESSSVVGYTVTNSSNRAGWFTGDKLGTLCAGGNHEVSSLQHGVLAFDTTQVTHPENRSNPKPGDPCHSLPAAGHAPTVISITGKVTHALTHEGHDASEDGTGRGTPIVVDLATERFRCADCGNRFGINDEPDALLDGSHTNSVVCPRCSSTGLHADALSDIAYFDQQAIGQYAESGVASSIMARDYKSAKDLVVNALRHKTHPTSRAGEGEVILQGVTEFLPQSSRVYLPEGVAPALQATGKNDGNKAPQVLAGIPRRLMPIECERLMGWPDNWTAVPDEKGKPASDAVRYKACGNGVVSHCPEWIARRLQALEEPSDG